MQLLCYARLLCNTRMFTNKCFVSYCGCGALCTHFCASPSSREAYRDRRLTTNFELWVEIFCVPTCFHIYEDSKTLSVCPYPEKRNHPSFVNISPTLVIDTSMEMSSRVLQHGNPKIWFFFQKRLKLNFDFYWRAEITLASSISVLHWYLILQWKCLHEYYTMETRKCEFHKI